jgi:hypothetical protein
LGFGKFAQSETMLDTVEALVMPGQDAIDGGKVGLVPVVRLWMTFNSVLTTETSVQSPDTS